MRAMVWERPIQHSLRLAPEGGGFLGGFVMPYHALLDEFERQPELNPTDYMAFAPDLYFCSAAYLWLTQTLTHRTLLSWR